MVRAVVVNQKAKNWWETVYMKMEEEDYVNAKEGERNSKQEVTRV